LQGMRPQNSKHEGDYVFAVCGLRNVIKATAL
jgi:hypothetical protein